MSKISPKKYVRELFTEDFQHQEDVIKYLEETMLELISCQEIVHKGKKFIINSLFNASQILFIAKCLIEAKKYMVDADGNKLYSKN